MSEGSREQHEGAGSPGARWARRGALVGAVAGLLCALGDFGAAWLWMPLWADRLTLLLRLVATMVPVGAALGAVGGAWAAGGRAAVERLATSPRARRRLAPLPFLVLAAPGLLAVSWLLFTGGKTSALPYRTVWVTAVSLVLLAGLYVALRIAAPLLRRGLEGSAVGGRLLGGAFLLAYVLVSKADQHVLPNLYAYLHASLAAAGFVLAAIGVLLLAAHSPRALAVDARGNAWAVGAVMVLAAVFTTNLLTLDANQNVRVAMFDPRAATSRSLMHGLEPLIETDAAQSAATRDAIERAREERRRRQQLIEGGGLPTWSGAHVLLITVDALRADHMGTYGYERDTSPHMDALAAESVVFERAYTQAPHSSYSLCSMMTSEYLHETVDIGLPLPEETLPTALGDDYYTAGFYTLGIFHTEGERVARYEETSFGFDRHDHHDVLAERKTEQALEEMDRIVDRGEPPSMMWVHYFDVHEPYRETHFGSSDLDRYDSEIRKVDAEVAALVAAAEERFERDVIVVLTADHGEEFRDHGGVYHGSTLYDEQIRVPLIVRAPDLEPRRVQAPVELVDVAPTVLGMVGRPVPESMRGDDLRALALGRVADVGPAFAGVTYKRMVVRWPHKLIADLRFNLFQLYDLSADPHERTNLANREPEILEELKGEVYAWIDTLSAPPGAEQPTDPRLLAIERGRLRDRRAVEPLGELVTDEEAPLEMRREASRILGMLSDRRAAPHLVSAMRSPEPTVAAEAAIALGRMYDDRAREPLRQLVHAEDPDVRVRAAVSLGRLRDTEAVPALIEALWAAPSTYEREEAVRWLGRLRDGRAVEPLLALIPEFRIRDLSVVALGTIGDRRAYEPLADMLDWEHHTSIRDKVVRGLGQLGDPRAVPRLVTVAANEPELENTSESLVRLGAIETGAIGGVDVRPGQPGLRGFGTCHAGPEIHDWNYRNRTWCETSGDTVRLSFAAGDSVKNAAGGAVAILRARRVDDGAPVAATVTLNGEDLGSIQIEGQWHETRWTVAPALLEGTRSSAVLHLGDPNARVRVDHLLVVPEPTHVAAADDAPAE